MRHGTLCFFRITLLEDELFPTFSRYFLEKKEPTFRLGSTEFLVTEVLNNNIQPSLLSERDIQWSQYLSYAELINNASQTNRRIALRFLTPTSFRRRTFDFLLPDPRLVFRSFQKRFEEFSDMAFPPDFEEQVEFHTGISSLSQVQTGVIKTKKVSLIGFTGRVTYEIERDASPELIHQMNLLADFAFFCGAGRKTAVGMGQTVRSA